MHMQDMYRLLTAEPVKWREFLRDAAIAAVWRWADLILCSLVAAVYGLLYGSGLPAFYWWLCAIPLISAVANFLMFCALKSVSILINKGWL
jgi:hypothetical protein